ncbi:methyltransferase type 12 [Adhaeribacter arboris]|uniref:Methyltransferase type 12 n=1 Tax=Adhaeribacter arboris TaxID=2072846 RepID=A0A2T2Y961_9BACT|nr:methyltransferase domain-containing protein [Adhaeribacter arboris]PSR52054.1 methyltransferase type 12 [Adhaeribacter arboris]
MKKFFQKLFSAERNPVMQVADHSIKPQLPLKGFVEGKTIIPLLDHLTDEELSELNSLLNWNSFIVDSQGRRFGNIAWSGKRETPQHIPDPRHALLSKRIDLSTKHILEIGCFEGIHTVSLCQLAAKVTAIDSRVENVVKTIVRTAFFNYHPTVFKCNVEAWENQFSLLKADVCHHIGVLYHLKNPVKHLLDLGKLINKAILLDTHIAHSEEALEQDEVDGKKYLYKKYMEGKDVFSGMYEHAKWLPLDTILEVLKDQGFVHSEILEKRNERNGPRVLVYLTK